MSNRLQNLDFSESTVIASNIRKLMEIHNISESQLANALGFSVMTIRRVLSGETEDPRISTLSLIADFFKISIDSLLDAQNKPIKMLQNNKVQHLPIISWAQLSSFFTGEVNDYSTWERWYPFAKKNERISKNTFVLESKKSMQPRFPDGSLLIIDPDEPPLDGDIVLIKNSESLEFSIRELVIDSPKWILRPVISGSQEIFFDKDKYHFLGTAILTILHSRD